MKKYTSHKATRPSRRKWRRVVLIAFAVMLVGGVAGSLAVRRTYMQNLLAVDVAAKKEIVVAIPTGSTLEQIAQKLKSSGIIRDEGAFKQYARGKQIDDKLKAGTYRFTTDLDVVSIADNLASGNVAVDLFTILPGQRIDQIRQDFIEGGFAEAEVDAALDPAKYKGNVALSDKPAGASLEGYLYPDSFQKTAETSAATIVLASLNEMSEALTTEVRSAYAKQGLTTHQAVTMASIVEREVASQEDRATAAQVFLKRLSLSMLLGSDVTACYGAINAGVMKDGDNCNNYVLYDTPYNTRVRGGIPPGPISNVTKSGLQAVANPSKTDYLYFVAGDDGITYFSRTDAEHQALTAQHCKKLCQ